MVDSLGQVVGEMTECVVAMVSRLQVDQRSVSNVLQDEEGESQEAGANQVTNLEHVRGQGRSLIVSPSYRGKVRDGCIVWVCSSRPHPVDQDVAEIK